MFYLVICYYEINYLLLAFCYVSMRLNDGIDMGDLIEIR